MNRLELKKTMLLKVISRQLPPEDEMTAEQKFMFAVVRRALQDLFLPSKNIYRRTAIEYFKTDMPHAQLVGLDPDYVREQIAKAL